MKSFSLSLLLHLHAHYGMLISCTALGYMDDTFTHRLLVKSCVSNHETKLVNTIDRKNNLEMLYAQDVL